MKESMPPYMEWEILHEPTTVSKISDRTELPKGEKRIVLCRDGDYNLRATLYFKDSDFADHLRQSSVIAGSFAEKFDIQGSYLDSVPCTLESCLIGKTEIHIAQEKQEILDTATLRFHGLKMKYGNEKEGTRLVEWYLNGPEGDVFSRVTERKVLSSYSRERFAAKQNKIDSIEVKREALELGGGDFLMIKTSDLQFLIARAPNGVGPSWSSNIGIEYHRDWGRIPDVQEREKIEGLCSFVLGRQLLRVGHTIYGQTESMLEAYAIEPWGREARSFCSKRRDRPPIRIGNGQRGKAEDIINQLLPKYYEMHEPLRLKEALWNYWISRNVPPGTNLPILAAALESLINGWFKYPKSPSQGRFMEKEKFEALLKEEIEAIKTKLKKTLDGKETTESEETQRVNKIVHRILNAFEFGILERYRVFFKEIKLVTNEREKKAIEERHRFVHGHVLYEKTDWERVIRYADVFETLLHKVLLTLLGYSGALIDRSEIGWKDMQLT